jgi:hypothetical protein
LFDDQFEDGPTGKEIHPRETEQIAIDNGRSLNRQGIVGVHDNGQGSAPHDDIQSNLKSDMKNETVQIKGV